MHVGFAGVLTGLWPKQCIESIAKAQNIVMLKDNLFFTTTVAVQAVKIILRCLQRQAKTCVLDAGTVRFFLNVCFLHYCIMHTQF